MYDQFYGFSGRPFQLTPDPAFYFESLTHRKALSYLGYGLAQGEGFIVITGEVGAGKSTLVSHLMQTIDRARLTAATIVTSQLDSADLVAMTAQSFGIDTRGMDKAGMLKAIENFLHDEARAGRRCLLVVDEAQNLGIGALEELRMLSNFQLGASALLQIFLLGQPEFRDLLQNAPEVEQLRQRVIATHHLEPMSEDEVEPYILHRLKRAGWDGRPIINDDAIAALYDETDGVPRKINAIMNRALLMGAVEQVNVIDGPLITAVVADMAGQPFAYEAPMSSKAPLATPVATAAEEVEDAAQESAPDLGEVEEAPLVLETAEVIAMPAPAAPLAVVSEPVVATAVEMASAAGPEDLQARVERLEKHVAEQDDNMRRVLGLLIDWMEKENQSLADRIRSIRAA